MSSKSTTIVNLVLVFFIALLSFSIGTFVGKKYSDNQHQLAALEPGKTEKHAEREVASVSTEKHGEKSGTMSDEEIAKLAEEFVADDATSNSEAGHGDETTAKTADHHEAAPAAAHGHSEHGSIATTAKPESVKPDHTHPADSPVKHSAEPLPVAKDLAQGKTPTTGAAVEKKAATTAENRLPSSLPKNIAQYAVGKFTVQVAAYADEAEAQKLASDLKAKGYMAFYMNATVNGKTWYRVRVGQFPTQKEAQDYRNNLLSNAKVSSAIVQKITE